MLVTFCGPFRAFGNPRLSPSQGQDVCRNRARCETAEGEQM